MQIAIKIQHQDIKEGTGRNCRNCAIARALNRLLPKLGLDHHYAWVEPYGSMVRDAEGIQIIEDYSHRVVAEIAEQDLPYELVEWAMNFDSWDEMRHEGWRAYEKRTGEYYPLRPRPVTFQLAFKSLATPTA